jgi:hypothetical protein
VEWLVVLCLFYLFPQSNSKKHLSVHKTFSLCKVYQIYRIHVPVLHKLNKIPEKVVDGQWAMNIRVSIMNRDELKKKLTNY